MAGKTGEYNESVLLTNEFDFIFPLLAFLKVTRLPLVSLWEFDLIALSKRFREACDLTGCELLNFTLYGNRHGGATHQRLLGVPMADIKKRGRWRSDNSLRRYEKATSVLAQAAKLPPATREFAQQVRARLPDIMNAMHRAIALPSYKLDFLPSRSEMNALACTNAMHVAKGAVRLLLPPLPMSA